MQVGLIRLYLNQSIIKITTQIKVGNIKTDHIKIQRGVRHGCILLLLLVKVYSLLFKETLHKIPHFGVKING